MKLLALFATAVYGNLVATLYPEELQGYAKALLEVVNSPQTLYYAADGSKCPRKIFSALTLVLQNINLRLTRIKIFSKIYIFFHPRFQTFH